MALVLNDVQALDLTLYIILAPLNMTPHIKMCKPFWSIKIPTAPNDNVLMTCHGVGQNLQ